MSPQGPPCPAPSGLPEALVGVLPPSAPTPPGRVRGSQPTQQGFSDSVLVGQPLSIPAGSSPPLGLTSAPGVRRGPRTSSLDSPHPSPGPDLPAVSSGRTPGGAQDIPVA